MSRYVPTIFVLFVVTTLSFVMRDANAQEGVRKQVFLVVDGDRLVASNVRTNGFDEIRLDARERMLDSEEGEGVIIVITNQRMLAYGAASGWSAKDRNTNEDVQSVSAADYAGLIVTSRRMLNFNGETGVWGEHQRRAGQ
jgi:hypothetical protein